MYILKNTINFINPSLQSFKTIELKVPNNKLLRSKFKSIPNSNYHSDFENTSRNVGLNAEYLTLGLYEGKVNFNASVQRDVVISLRTIGLNLLRVTRGD